MSLKKCTVCLSIPNVLDFCTDHTWRPYLRDSVCWAFQWNSTIRKKEIPDWEAPRSLLTAYQHQPLLFKSERYTLPLYANSKCVGMCSFLSLWIRYLPIIMIINDEITAIMADELKRLIWMNCIIIARIIISRIFLLNQVTCFGLNWHVYKVIFR